MSRISVGIFILICMLFNNCSSGSADGAANMYINDLSALKGDGSMVRSVSYQAEDHKYEFGTFDDYSHLYTGRGYVHSSPPWSGCFIIDVDMEADGQALLSYRYSTGSDADSPVTLFINEEKTAIGVLRGTGSYNDWARVDFIIHLKKGTSQISLTAENKGGINLDKADLSSVYASIDNKRTFDVRDVNSLRGKKLSLADRIIQRTRPPIYKDWNNYAAISNIDQYQNTALFSVSWDIVLPKGASTNWGLYGPILGLEWDKATNEYPFFSKKLINRKSARKIYDLIHSYNPVTMLGVEIRWDMLKDYELPPDHHWWKRDKHGDKIKAKRKAPIRYFTDCDNPEYIAHLVERCKVILSSGVVDFIMLDHMQSGKPDPALFVKALGEGIGKDKVIIGNTHLYIYSKMAPYIDAWGEMDGDEPSIILPWWENHGRRGAVFNCWEFEGAADDLKAMRYYTTLTMTLSDASMRYVDSGGSTRPRVWYKFWDTYIGRALGSGYRLNNCHSREYENGTVVCNNSGTDREVAFTSIRKRVSDGKTGKCFKLSDRDGDMFLYVSISGN